jgi:hypothetical protein
MSLQVSIIDLIFGIAARAMRAEELLESARGQCERFRGEAFNLTQELGRARAQVTAVESALITSRELAAAYRKKVSPSQQASTPPAALPEYCERLPDDELGPVVRINTEPVTVIEINDPQGDAIIVAQDDEYFTLDIPALRAFLALVPDRGDSPA